MKILVVGHLSIDRQESLAGSAREAYGGIYHAVRTLAALAGRGDVIVPVFSVHGADTQPLLNDLKRLSAVDPSGVYSVDVPTPRIGHPHGRGDHQEGPCNPHPPVPFSRIKPYLGADGILLNMVSGNDITLDTLDELRMAIRPRSVPVHFDYHNLTRGLGQGGIRPRRPLEEWRRWAFMLDTVQLNEEEIGGLTVERMAEQQTAGHLLTLGVKGVLVTKGERGVTVYRNERKHVMRHDIAVSGRVDRVSPVGCGDVFGASFLYHYLLSGDLLASAEKAGVSGAECAQEQSLREGGAAPDGLHPGETSGAEERRQ